MSARVKKMCFTAARRILTQSTAITIIEVLEDHYIIRFKLPDGETYTDAVRKENIEVLE